jgi:hypothetical protein
MPTENEPFVHVVKNLYAVPTLPLLHPEMAELYRQKVTTLAQALVRSETRTELGETVRGSRGRLWAGPGHVNSA